MVNTQISWGTNPARIGFNYPQGIAVDTDGHIYVGDTNNQRIFSEIYLRRKICKDVGAKRVKMNPN